jgi:hypothetical protein
VQEEIDGARGAVGNLLPLCSRQAEEQLIGFQADEVIEEHRNQLTTPFVRKACGFGSRRQEPVQRIACGRSEDVK